MNLIATDRVTPLPDTTLEHVAFAPIQDSHVCKFVIA